MKTHWLLEIWGGVSAEVHGPFDTPEERDELALKKLRESDQSSFHRLNVVDGVPEVYDYSGREVSGDEHAEDELEETADADE